MRSNPVKQHVQGIAVLFNACVMVSAGFAQNAVVESRRDTGANLPAYRKKLEIDRFLKPRSTRLIDLPSVLRLAHCNSLDIAVIEQRLAIAQTDEEIAKFAILPDISIGPRYEHHTGKIQETAGDVIDAHRSSLFTGGIASFDWSPGKILFGPKAARLLRYSALERRDDAYRIVAFDAAMRYYDLVRAQYQVAITRFQVERTRELAGFFRNQFEAGQVLKVDYLRIQSQQDKAESDLVAAEAAREFAVQELLEILRLDHDLDMVTVGPDLTRASLLNLDQNESQFVEEATACRADLRDAAQQIEIARTNLANKGIAPFLPAAFLSHSSGNFRGGRNDEPNAASGGRSDFAASFQWTLKNLGLSNRAEYERTYYEWEIANLQYEQLRERVDKEVRQAIAAARAARRQIDLRQQALPVAREALELSEVRLRAGEGLAVDVLQAQDVLTKAESDYINALTDSDRAQITLWNRLGKMMPLGTQKSLSKKTVFELKTYTGIPAAAEEQHSEPDSHTTVPLVLLDDLATTVPLDLVPTEN
ncbi:MAG: TolC family protein [Candidatus Sumerlaeaceae bacterium]